MTHRFVRWCSGLGIALLLVPVAMRAQDSTAAKPKWSLNLYGFVMTDLIPDFGSIDPNWFDTERPTKLPAFKDEFGKNGDFYASVRQTRFGVKGAFPTSLGELTTRFEFDMFGVGADAGQTTIRLRYAYGQLGQFGIGQTESPFMDNDIFPNTLEYWGPNGMVFFRNVQVRWMPIQGETHLIIALERPGASGDQGQYAGRVELGGTSPRFPLPDLSAQYRVGMKWGYLQFAGILRDIVWDDLNASDTLNLSGHAVGWGLNVSTNVKVTKMDVIKAQVVYGQGVQNYMNDAPVDIGTKDNFSNPMQPFLGVALPLASVVAYLDHTWNDHFTSSIGYSGMRIYNSNGQLPSDFKIGQYASGNVLYTPVPFMMVGVEGIWGNRQNKSDGWTANDFRLQFSGKFTYGLLLAGK